MAYLLRVMVALDILIMALFNGKRNETLSAAAWSLEQDGKWQGKVFRPLIDGLFVLVQKNHCKVQWLHENTIQTAKGVAHG